MRKILTYAIGLSLVVLAFSAQAATPVKKKRTVPKATAKSATVRKTVPKRHGTSSRTTTASAARGGKKAPAKKTTWRNRQLAPTPQRYKEIQDALVAKGYLNPEDAGGTWNQSSVEALKRFQSEQKLESNGKINSLSLIALGLGPKHESAPLPKPSADRQSVNQ